MSKKKNPSMKGPKKSQVAKAKEVEKMIQVAKAQPKRAKHHPRQVRQQVERCLDGSSLISNEGSQVRLPLAQLYPKPTSKYTLERKNPKPPTTQTLPLTSFHQLEIVGTAVVMKDERHNCQGLIQLPLINIPISKPTTKKPFRFLDLPNEIQDMVFEQLIPCDQFHIFWLNHHHTKTLTHRRFLGLPKLLPDVLTRRVRQQCQLNADRTTVLSHVYKSLSPISSLWVNRQFYLRASRVFYYRNTFIFSNLGPLRHFLDTLSIPNKESVRSLKLIHTPYGHPCKTSHSIWKTVYDHAWIALCLRIKTEMPNIRSLDLEFRMHTMPLDFAPLDLDKLYYSGDFRTEWLIPLCLFKGLRLDRCCVRIISHVKADTVLEVESWKLRKELMRERWDETKEAKRDAFGFEKRKKKVKVLRIGC